MSALPKARDLACTPSGETVIEDVVRDGAHQFQEPLDPAACAGLAAALRATRDIGPGLFLSQAEFEAGPRSSDVNPKPGRNLADRIAERLGFIEQAPQIVEGVSALLGEGYEVLDRRVVCALPATALPDWLRGRPHGDPADHLGAFVRAQHRDITWVHGAEFHQDLIAYPRRAADFLTLHVALQPVGRADGPVCLLEGSHALGGALFPHNLTRIGDADWLYVNRPWGDTVARQRVLTGEAGSAALWHPCALHGAQPAVGGDERFSLRYLLARRGEARSGVDVVNARLKGPLSLGDTRSR